MTDAIETAGAAAEAEDAPATAVTTVEETTVKDEVDVNTSIATGKSQGVQKATPILQTYRLFVGSVPTTLTEQDIEGPFKEVSSHQL